MTNGRAADVVGRLRDFVKASVATNDNKISGGKMFGVVRSAFIGLTLLVSLAVGITPSSAGDYPNRPVHWLIGFAAGGPVDLVARIMSQWLSDHFGQQFVVENRAGSGGKHRGRDRDQRDARRLHHPVRRARTTPSAPRSISTCPTTSSATPFRSPASCNSPTCWWCRTRCRSRTSRSSSTTARPIPARCPMPRRAMARRCTCPANCSRR